MKTPRVHDFDPNAKVPQLGSPMDSLPAIQKPTPQREIKTDQPERPLTRWGQEVKKSTPVDTIASTGQRPNGSRVIKRHSFEFYKDQVEALQRLALENKLRGGEGNQSKMVREAIDLFLSKQRGRASERTNAR